MIIAFSFSIFTQSDTSFVRQTLLISNVVISVFFSVNIIRNQLYKDSVNSAVAALYLSPKESMYLVYTGKTEKSETTRMLAWLFSKKRAK